MAAVAFLMLSVSTFQLYAAGKQGKNLKSIDAQTSYDLIQENQDNEDFIIIDVRTPGEYAAGHIKDAMEIDFYKSDFVPRLKELDKSKTYFIYCRSGSRSGKTLLMMDDLGFKDVYNMQNGINEWKALSLPLVKE